MINQLNINAMKKLSQIILMVQMKLSDVNYSNKCKPL